MPVKFLSAKGHTRLNVMARRYTREAVEARHEDAKRMLATGIAMLEQAMLLGADKKRLHGMACELHTVVSNLCAGMQRDMDEQGLFYEYQPIDLTKLDLVLVRLTPKEA